MDQKQMMRLREKYGYASGESGKKEMSIGPRANRGRAMTAQGRPKDAKKIILRLARYLGQERRLMFLAFLIVIVHNIFSLLASYMLRPIINRYIYFDPADGDLSARLAGLAHGLLILAAVYAVAVFCQWLQQRIMLEVSQKSLRHMRGELFAKLQTLPIRYFDSHTTGDIMSRFTNDIDVIGEMLNTTLVQIISGVLTIAGTVFLMLYTNLLLGTMTILMVPLLTSVSRAVIARGRTAYKAQQKNLGSLNGFSQEMITGQKVIKVFNHEETAMEEFSWLNAELRDAQIKAQFMSGCMGPLTHQLCNAGYALIACVGAILVVRRGFDLGGLAISVNYTRQFNRPINEISMQLNTVFSALAGAERVFEVMDRQPESETQETLPMEKIEENIEVQHVNFGYVPGVTVLHDISFYAKPGQKIAFVGSTGAGKTTVTNLLSRFYDIQAGAITVDGIPLEKIERAFLRSNIAMVLQDTHLFTGTVRENIRYGRLDATDEEVEAAAKLASAHLFITQLEHGYDTMLEQDGGNLSQGQRQLLNIARAAVSNAPILILDEATSSVDTRTERHIEEGMDALMKNRTTLVIAHRISTVRKANAIMVLEAGQIIERGTHEELLALNGRYAAFYHEIDMLQ